MGREVTLGMTGTLQLSLDGEPTNRPLEVAIHDIQLDLAQLMEDGLLTIDERTDRAELTLVGCTLTLSMDSREVLSRGSSSILLGIEELL